MALELPEGWRDQLPDDIKTNGVLDDVKTIDQMATMIVNGRQLQTHQISIPSEDASSEKREQFLKDLQAKIPDLVYVGEGADMGNIYDRMGRPKEAAGYELGEIPDPLRQNFSTLAEKAHAAGINEKQMKAITDTIVGDYNSNVALHDTQMGDNMAAIKKEFGEATDSTLEASANFAKRLGFADDFAEGIKSGTAGLENLKAFNKMVDGYESPGPKIGDEIGSAGSNQLTPAAAEMQLSEIMNNKEHPYWDGSSPAHDASIGKVVELTRMADAGKVSSEADKFRDALSGRG